MRELKRRIDNFISGRCGKYPLATMQECIYIYEAMRRREKPAFINGDVNEILVSCGIATIPYGIGWKVK